MDLIRWISEQVWVYCFGNWPVAEVTVLGWFQYGSGWKSWFYIWCHLLEETPGQQRREALKHAGRQVEDWAEAWLQGCGTSSIDHNHLVDLLRILVGQECAERHPAHGRRFRIELPTHCISTFSSHKMRNFNSQAQAKAMELGNIRFKFECKIKGNILYCA